MNLKLSKKKQDLIIVEVRAATMIDLGTLALGLILILAFALWKHSNKFKGQLESLGIPVEKTFLIFGMFFFAQN